jgi:hypothetical protein
MALESWNDGIMEKWVLTGIRTVEFKNKKIDRFHIYNPIFQLSNIPVDCMLVLHG